MALEIQFALSYANLILEYLEGKLHKEVEKTLDRVCTKYIIKRWKRFLNDCFLFEGLINEDLKIFNNMLNTLHPSIKFMIESNCNESTIPGYPHRNTKLYSRNRHILQKNWHTPIYKFLHLPSIIHNKKHPTQHSKMHVYFSNWIQSMWNSIRRFQSIPHNEEIPFGLINDGIYKAVKVSIAQRQKKILINTRSHLLKQAVLE